MIDNKGAALQYKGDVPRVIASARGILVQKLLEIARENNIPVYRDPDMAEVLSAMDNGTEIPAGLYRAVAEVLAHCYRVNSRFREKMDGMLV